VRLWVKSLGCKVNLADAARALEGLDESSLQVVATPAQADVALLHTCTVTHKADRDVRKVLNALLREQPGLPVVVAGCAAVTDGERLRALPNVRAVLGPGDPTAVTRVLAELARQVSTATDAGRAGGAPGPFAQLGRRRAVLKVQDGCNAGCGYCVIPRVRGPERSRALGEALAEALRRAEQGHREVVLTGIHLGGWGRELAPRRPLAELVEQLAEALATRRPACRLRLSSIEPLEWTEELLAAVARWPNVCRHFHVPLQSGADDVLRAMGRPYDSSRYQEVIGQLRRRFPEAALGADVLVGFPGEGEREARATVELLSAAPLDYLHVFAFSARPETRAAALPGRPDPQAVRARSDALLALGRRRWQAFLRAGLGQRHQVLLEDRCGAGLRGRSQHYRPIILQPTDAAPLTDELLGGLVEVTTVELQANALRATWLPQATTQDPGEG
jgi:threonylcarbamoyladenosine tRNA methylthiotransferase MtaB